MELYSFSSDQVFLCFNQALSFLQIEDLLSFDASRTDQTLVYILTLGVVDSYRNLGIGNSLFFRFFLLIFLNV